MAKTLADIQRQIQRLEQQAQEIRSREVSGVIARIKEAVKFYDLNADDIFGGDGRKRVRSRQSASQAAAGGRGKRSSVVKKVPIKYRDNAGNTWTGRGLKPRWLVAALQAGRKLEDFTV